MENVDLDGPMTGSRNEAIEAVRQVSQAMTANLSEGNPALTITLSDIAAFTAIVLEHERFLISHRRAKLANLTPART